MAVELSTQANEITGEVRLEIGPATVAAERDRMLDAALSEPLTDAAEKRGAVLASPPHRFARALPGKDAQGLTCFVIRGRIEAERLIPNHGASAAKR